MRQAIFVEGGRTRVEQLDATEAKLKQIDRVKPSTFNALEYSPFEATPLNMVREAVTFRLLGFTFQRYPQMPIYVEQGWELRLCEVGVSEKELAAEGYTRAERKLDAHAERYGESVLLDSTVRENHQHAGAFRVRLYAVREGAAH